MGVGQAIVRVVQKDHDFNLSFELLPQVEPVIAEGKQRTVVEHCRATYALHQSKVEDILKDALQINTVPSIPVQPSNIFKEEKLPPDILVERPDAGEKKKKPEADLQLEARQFVDKEVERERQREHRFIQEFIKKVAEARNFKAIIEEPVNDGTGSVDVSLHRDELKIACEISVTNTVEYEVQNIQKCFSAGYLLVFMIANDAKHLSTIRESAVLAIDPSFHNRLFFVSKDNFVNQLDLILAQTSQPEEIRAKGYRVKLNYMASSDKQGQQKVLRDVILSSLRREKTEER